MASGNSVSLPVECERLRPTSRGHSEAVADLRRRLLTVSRFEVARRHRALVDPENSEAIAQQAAASALTSVLSRLDEFRGQSEFSTWAAKFAIVEAAREIRCRTWRGREVFFDASSSSLAGEVSAALREAIEHDLSGRQREVLVATALNAVPIDVVAERLGTSRGAVYESIHGARQVLRAVLTERGLELEQDMESESS